MFHHRVTSDLSRWFHRRIVYPGVVYARGEQAVFSALREMRQTETLSTAELLRRQETKLASVLNRAATNSRYYRERWPELGRIHPDDAMSALQQLPFVTKRVLQTQPSEILTGWRGRTTSKTTGGSTGEPVQVVKNSTGLGREMAASWMAYGWLGIEMGDRAVRFWGNPLTRKKRLRFRAADFAMHRIRFSAFEIDDSDMERHWARCLAFRPQWFYGYTNVLEMFAEFVKRKGLNASLLPLKGIVTTAEPLSLGQKELLESVFGAPVQNEYGCGEVGPVAYSCEQGKLHIMSENVVVEILTARGKQAAPGDSGEVVVTDLTNYAMPLIRYRLGDYGIRAEGCTCGRGFPVLEKIWGRVYDAVYTPAGRRWHGEKVKYLIMQLHSEGVEIQQFQVVQDGPGTLDIALVTETPIDVATEERIAAYIRTELDGMEARVRRVRAVERSPSGKMRLVRNDWLKQKDDA